MLNISNIKKTFNKNTADEVKALQGVSLNIKKSSFVIVIGSNGSGKSTLLNAIAGTFITDSGKIELDNQEITKWKEHKRAKLIARVFQNPFSGTAPDMTIAENIALASLRGKKRTLKQLLNKKKKREIEDIVKKLNMNLENRLSNIIGSLSGGQRQAITLLMTTCIKPKLLLLDEHTAALDPKSADKIIHLTKELIEEEKLTTLMITHSMHQAINLGDRLIMMHKGKIVYDVEGTNKNRLRVRDLLDKFEEIKQIDQLDENVAEMLSTNYI